MSAVTLHDPGRPCNMPEDCVVCGGRVRVGMMRSASIDRSSLLARLSSMRLCYDHAHMLREGGAAAAEISQRATRPKRAGRFSKRRQLVDRSSGWVYSEIEAWAAALPTSSSGPARRETAAASRSGGGHATQSTSRNERPPAAARKSIKQYLQIPASSHLVRHVESRQRRADPHRHRDFGSGVRLLERCSATP